MTTIRVFDSESDGFWKDASRFWCIACRDLDGTKKFFGPDEIEDGIAYLEEADVIIAHNLLGHDLPLIYKLFPDFKCPLYEDTLILSRLFNPDRQGGHSIEAWGPRVGLDKPDHKDWSQFSHEMEVRCTDDAEINARMIKQLQFEMGKEDWKEAIEREYNIQILQTKQEETGFKLDVPQAEENLRLMQAIHEDIMSELIPSLPMQMKIGTHYKAPFTKAGKLNHHVAKFLPEETHDTIMGPFTGVSWTPFNLNSPKQVTELLLANGWEPTEFNYKKKPGGGYELNKDGSYQVSSPKVSEDLSCLESVTGELGQLIVKERVVRSRMGYIHRANKDGTYRGWLNDMRADGRVEGRAIPMGTPTSRYTHSGIVNVPKPGVEYGGMIRSLLIADEGKSLVGTDACGLEARVGGHFTFPHDGGEFARLLLEGDIHQMNADAFSEAVGFEIERDQAKTVYYGVMYGAQPRKVASSLGVSFDVGTVVYDEFWKANPGLDAARKVAQEQAKRKGYILGLDGRRIPCRSGHSALNYTFQSAGALIMKHAFNHVFFNGFEDPLDLWKGELRWECLLTQHDEAQAQMEEKYIEEHVELWHEAGRLVTDHFNINIPIEFESKVGRSWADTH